METIESTTIYLQRHGESETNVSKLFTCRKLDPSLTETGRQQIEAKASLYRSRNIDRIICSPSRRARQTAEIIGRLLGIGYTINDALFEVDLGELEGTDERESRYLDLFLGVCTDWFKHGLDTRFPGGESKTDVESRIDRFLPLASPSTVLIGHCTLFAVVLAREGMPFDNINELFLPRGGAAWHVAGNGGWKFC